MEGLAEAKALRAALEVGEYKVGTAIVRKIYFSLVDGWVLTNIYDKLVLLAGSR